MGPIFDHNDHLYALGYLVNTVILGLNVLCGNILCYLDDMRHELWGEFHLSIMKVYERVTLLIERFVQMEISEYNSNVFILKIEIDQSLEK